MAINKKDKELLLRSLEEQLEPKETAQLEAALKESAALREEKRQLLKMRTILEELKYTPAPEIADAVMQQIQEPVIERGITRMLPQVAAACILLILAGVLAIYFTEGSLTAEAVLGVSELAPEEAYTFLNY